jgi:ABC-type nitrate/sulfonate/bicarbonate transport system substrate-binding protein
MTAVSVSTFTGVGSLPLFAADRLGLFAAQGIEVCLEETRSSDALMTGLLDGTYDVVHAAPDNVVAWADKTGEDLRAWIGGSSGPLALVGGVGVTAVAELAGRRVAVDAPGSGFVGVLRLITRAHGLGDDEYELVPVGATPLRLRALQGNKAVATLLSIPSSLRAEAAGFPVLARHDTVIPRYQSFAGSSRAQWLDEHPNLADAYLRALVATLTRLYNPLHRETALDLARELFDLSAAEAQRAVDAVLDPRDGWPPSGLVDLAGLAAVCAIRAETSTPPKHAPEAYVDFRPYRRVLSFGDHSE